MTISVAYWCILIAVILPYVWTTIAKSGGKGYNNKDPRGWTARQENPRTRYANGAQLNSFESNPVFIGSVLMAQFAHLPEQTIALCSIIYVIARVLHGVFYISAQHALRSLVWFVGIGAVFYLIVQSALHITAAA